MASKILISTLFAVVLHCRISAAFEKYCQLSQDDIQAILCLLDLNEVGTFSSTFAASTSIFDSIEDEARIRLKIPDKYQVLLPEVETVKVQVVEFWSQALASTVASIAAIVPNVSGNMNNISAEVGVFKELADEIYLALSLSRESCGKNLPRIREIGVNVTAKVFGIFKSSFSLMKNDRVGETEIIRAIELVEDKLVVNTRTRLQAYFNAIEILAKINCLGSADQSEDILNGISMSRKLAISSGRDEAGTKYALLRAYFIASLVNETQIAFNFGAIMSAEKSAISSWTATLEPIFGLLSKIYAGGDVSLSTKAIRDEGVRSLKGVHSAFRETLEIIRIETSSEIVIDESAVSAVMEGVIEGILGAIVDSRGERSSDNLSKIEIKEKEVVAGITDLLSRLYKIVTDVSSNRNDVSAAIGRVLKNTLSNVEGMIGAVFSVIKYIAAHKCDNYFASPNLLSVMKSATLVMLAEQQNHMTWSFAQFRTLFVRNFLRDNQIFVDYCVDVIS